MITNPAEYVPKSYRSRPSTFWWMGRWPYLKFILREVSSVFVAWIVVVTLLQIRAVEQGPAQYAEFQRWLTNPIVMGLNVVSLFFVLFHTVTWFNLAPKAMAVRTGGKRLPDVAVTAPNYIAWAVVSAAVAWIVLRG